MFSWIPLRDYTDIFYLIIGIVSLYLIASTLRVKLLTDVKTAEANLIGAIFLIVIVLYIGLRPISGAYFGDMATYAAYFKMYQLHQPVLLDKDVLFNSFTSFCAQIITVKYYFLLIDIIYIFPLYFFSKKRFGKYWFYGFFLFIASFSFWSYGTNGLRNGLATSLFILGLCFYDKKRVAMYFFFILSIFVHKSTIIPIAAFAVALILLRRPKLFFYIWGFAIPLSLLGGSMWESFFGSIGLFSERAQTYLTSDSAKVMDLFSSTGFRWDFLLYSAFAMLTGWYYIIKKGIQDKFYLHLFGIYAIGNAFWILVIRAAYSNRFAYLSWFLMAPVIIYPLCKYKIMEKQGRFLSVVIFLYTFSTLALIFIEELR